MGERCSTYESRWLVREHSTRVDGARSYGQLAPLLPDNAIMSEADQFRAPLSTACGLHIANQRGSQSYKHLKILQQMGFISSETSGRNKLYKTTNLFSDTFGLSEELKTMKQQLTRDKNIKSNF